jgi:hypothetical protein
MTVAGDFTEARWRKSSYSGSNGGGGDTCVEIARTEAAWVGVRDSKYPEAGVLVFGAGAFERFLTAIPRW